jgi:hypothetical protein
LSKGRFSAFKRKLPSTWKITPEPAWIPPSILRWIATPRADYSLGEKILTDMRDHFQQ